MLIKIHLELALPKNFYNNGENLYESDGAPPFYYYQFHNREVGKGFVSVDKTPVQNSETHFKPLENINTNSLGLSSIPRLLEDSEYPPESTPVYRIRRDLVEFISKWQFYNAGSGAVF